MAGVIKHKSPLAFKPVRACTHLFIADVGCNRFGCNGQDGEATDILEVHDATRLLVQGDTADMQLPKLVDIAQLLSAGREADPRRAKANGPCKQ